jgi:hypothetical protein
VVAAVLSQDFLPEEGGRSDRWDPVVSGWRRVGIPFRVEVVLGQSGFCGWAKSDPVALFPFSFFLFVFDFLFCFLFYFVSFAKMVQNNSNKFLYSSNILHSVLSQ